MEVSNDSFSHLHLTDHHGINHIDEPVVVGVPVRDGHTADTQWYLQDENGPRIPCQSRVLSKRPSGCIHWVELSFRGSLPANGTKKLSVIPTDARHEPRAAELISCADDSLQILTHPSAESLLVRVSATRQKGAKVASHGFALRELSRGSVCTQFEASGKLGKHLPLDIKIAGTYFHTSGLCRLDVTLCNPRRAEHPGGFWDLGDPQSEYLQDAWLDFDFPSSGNRTIQWSTGFDSRARAIDQDGCREFSVSQHSSGGENWQSRTHVNANGDVPPRQRGFSAHADAEKFSGLRADPVVSIGDERNHVSISPLDFWEKFPSELIANQQQVRLAIFPDTGTKHELQGGERITRSVWIRRSDQASSPADLRWTHQPIAVRPCADTLRAFSGLEWFASECESGDFATEKPWQSSLDAMLSGPKNFFWKREHVDEFGWRNFGDFWADHEEAYSDDPSPVISHYNNQYDLLYGLLRQYLASGDHRWWQLARPLALHIIDIDIYHTDQDRTAFNHGLFWHTAHYRDAGTSTHRTFSRSMTGPKHAVFGGGPGAEHQYASGLALYYLLTGHDDAKEAVVQFAQRVISVDDGRQSTLAPLSGVPTGLVSSTVEVDFHGVGRGVGNSINVLLDAWQISRDARFLHKCKELIWRVAHPDDDVATLDLTNAELRWSYTVALQAFVRFIEVVGCVDQRTCQYVRDCLLTYGRWMVTSERLYMDHREQLEFPTETWFAQDLRKGNSLLLIAGYAEQEEADRMHERGREIFDDALGELLSSNSGFYTRPCAILLQQIPVRESIRHAPVQWRPPTTSTPWPPRVAFTSQRADLRKRIRSVSGLFSIAFSSLRPERWNYFLPHTPAGRVYRQIIRCINRIAR